MIDVINKVNTKAVPAPIMNKIACMFPFSPPLVSAIFRGDDMKNQSNPEVIKIIPTREDKDFTGIIIMPLRVL
tara:strand:+ start:324 stop:542 length:219 start_codon:yes stop_codon:yes gene_type:complete